MKSPTILQKENGRLRELLRQVLALDDGNVSERLGLLQQEIRDVIRYQDRRTEVSGFKSPENLAKVATGRRLRREAFQAQHGAILRELKGQGLSLSRIAEALNERGIPAPSGGKWSAGSVKFQIDALPEE